MVQELLQQLGLTKGEAAVYLALLELGTTTVGPITKKSGVAYSNVYTILHRLIEKGLASFVIKSKTKQYTAAEPHELIEHVEKQAVKVEEVRARLMNALPQFMGLARNKNKMPEEAEVFVGWKGAKTAYTKLLDYYTPKSKYLFFYVYSPTYAERVDSFFAQLMYLFKKKNIQFRGISNLSFRKSWFVKHTAVYTEMRYVRFPLPTNIEIVNTHVLITAWSQTPVCFLINSDEVAADLRAYFENVWKRGEV